MSIRAAAGDVAGPGASCAQEASSSGASDEAAVRRSAARRAPLWKLRCETLARAGLARTAGCPPRARLTEQVDPMRSESTCRSASDASRRRRPRSRSRSPIVVVDRGRQSGASIGVTRRGDPSRPRCRCTALHARAKVSRPSRVRCPAGIGVGAGSMLDLVFDFTSTCLRRRLATSEPSRRAQARSDRRSRSASPWCRRHCRLHPGPARCGTRGSARPRAPR